MSTPTVGRRLRTRWPLGVTVVVAIAVLVITYPRRKAEVEPRGPVPDATALAWLCEALHTRDARSVIEDFPDVSRARIKEVSNAVHGWGRHDLTVRVGAWNLKASYDGDAFGGTHNYDYQIATAGNAGAKIFSSLDDAKKWLGRFGAVREAPPTYSVALLDVKGGLGDRIYDIVSATYTDTSQSLEFQFNWYGFVDAMKPLCVK
jgi:hypothetical protein